MIALRSAVKSIADVESGKLGNYIGAAALKPFINSDLILGELREFTIPGTQYTGMGLTTEQFELICRGYVQALYQKANLTERQHEVAVKCAVLTSGLTRTGLDALIDEATGYQYERADDALQVKLRAFIADELRAWEKTFPDELWDRLRPRVLPGVLFIGTESGFWKIGVWVDVIHGHNFQCRCANHAFGFGKTFKDSFRLHRQL